MKMVLTASLHARPNPLCIDRARGDLHWRKAFAFVLPPINFSQKSVWMDWNLYKKYTA